MRTLEWRVLVLCVCLFAASVGGLFACGEPDPDDRPVATKRPRANIREFIAAFPNITDPVLLSKNRPAAEGIAAEFAGKEGPWGIKAGDPRDTIPKNLVQVFRPKFLATGFTWERLRNPSTGEVVDLAVLDGRVAAWEVHP